MEYDKIYKEKRLAEISRRRELKRKKRRRNRICALVTLAALGASMFGTFYTVSAKEITITEINEFEGRQETITVTTHADDVRDALNEQGIELSDTDKLNKAADTEISDNEEIVLRRGKEIKVVTPASEETVVVTSADTHEALKEAGYETDAEDEINLDGASIAESSVVELRSVTVTYETAEEELPFETVYRDDSSIYEGEETVITEGAVGKKVLTYKVSRYEDETEKGRTLESEEITAQPVNKVIAKGTKARPVATPAASASQAPKTAAESAGTINGYRYTKKITMNATAYTGNPSENGGSGRTAMGTPAVYGVVAVDPNVIPLGSKVFVLSADGQYIYGTARAEDTGGAIKGNKIDLCFNSNSEAIQFGRRDCIVYVLAD